jgi:ribosomal protein S18 acetylase RimI-like enzyme
MEIIIRPAQLKDFDEILFVEQKCYDPEIAYSLERLLVKYEIAKERFYVVEVKKSIVAYFWTELWKIENYNHNELFSIMKNSYHRKDGDTLYIGNLSVLPEARGNKIGEKMMEFMLKDLSKLKCSILAVPIESKAAIKIYDKLDYVPIKRIENYYAPGRSADILVKAGNYFA